MDRDAAARILAAALAEYRRLSYEQLVTSIGSVVTRDVEAPDRTLLHLEIQVVWDAKPGGAIRVLGSVDDGGWRAFHPLTQDFVTSA